MAAGKVWVLDTGTKGTGAEMVPLEKVLQDPAQRTPRTQAPPPRKPHAAKAPEPRQPSRFKLVDALSREVLAEGVDARAAVELLKDVRSMVDVSVYVWEPKRETWRPLTHGEKKLIWGFRGR